MGQLCKSVSIVVVVLCVGYRSQISPQTAGISNKITNKNDSLHERLKITPEILSYLNNLTRFSGVILFVEYNCVLVTLTTY